MTSKTARTKPLAPVVSSFDLSSLRRANETTVTLCHPVSKAPIDVHVTMWAPTSPTGREAMKLLLAEDADAAVKASNATECLVKLTKSWDLVIGEPVECTPDNARAIYTDADPFQGFSWISAQLFGAIGEVDRFFGTPKAS